MAAQKEAGPTAQIQDYTLKGEKLPIQVHGDTVDYFHEEQKVVGTGHVSIDYEGSLLTADKITVYLDRQVGVAEGNVVLKQEGSVFKGDWAEYDFKKKAGNVSRMDAEIQPFYGKAARFQKVSEGQYRVTDGYLTTCCGPNPFYRIQAKDVDIYPEKKVVVKHALLFVKGMPIMYIPYYVQPLFDFDRFPVQFVPGKNSEWGAFLLSKWRYNLIDQPSASSKGNILVDYRARRGWGVGPENYYRIDGVGRGSARYYFIEDDNPPENASSGRHRTQWRHQMPLTESTTLTWEMNTLSDATVVKDFFFREEYESNVFPDNYVSLITAKPEYTLSVLERHRMDDFFSVVERSPEVRFDTSHRQFADSPFYLREEYQFSNLKRRIANESDYNDVVRWDTNHTVSYPGHLGPVSVTPRVGTRQTVYSREIADDNARVRGTFDPGVDTSIRFFKTYDVYINRFGLDYNQIRHIFTPTAAYSFRPTPTLSYTRLSQFDSIDALDKQNFIRWSFENKFQTKHRTGQGLVSRDFARIIPFFDTNLDNGRAENVGFDVELRPYSWLSMEADGAYDTIEREWSAVNTDLYVERKTVRFGVGHRYVRDESAQTTGEIRWRVSPDVELKVYERYEFAEDRSKEFEVLLSKAFNCVIVDFTYNHGDGDTFYVLFRLKAFPNASFTLTQSYNKPKDEAPRANGWDLWDRGAP